MGVIDEFFAKNVWVAAVIAIAGTGLIILIIWLICRCRHRGRYDYTALNEDLALPHKIEMEKAAMKDAFRDSALMNCQFYLRSNPKYKYKQQLGDIGSRLNCSHFLVQTRNIKGDLMMVMLPRLMTCLINLDAPSRKVLNDMLHSLQYPYIYPVHEIDYFSSQELIIVMQALNDGGSLKDVIYRSRCLDSYQQKYQFKAKGLPIEQIKLYGLQIIKGLEFLKNKGFPPHAHLHSGNIYVQNKTCKIAGYESNFFGNNSKLHPIIKRKLKDNNEAVETLCFGHLIFEMGAGFECNSAHAEPHQLMLIQHPSVVVLLNYIFENESGTYPTISQIGEHPFFKDVQLPELKKYNPAPVNLSANMKSLLKSVKSMKPYRSSDRKNSAPVVYYSATTEDETADKNKRKKRRTSSTSGDNRKRKSSTGSLKLRSQPLTPPPAPPGVQTTVAGSAPVLSSLPEVSAPTNRQALLGDIRTGVSLKRTTTIDKSAPRV